MARLIDADALIKTIPNTNIDMFENCGRCTLLDKEEVIAIINKAPTIEAEPTKPGRWIYEPKDAIEMMYTKPKCSVCGYESADGLHYCSNCGAKMEEEE